MEFKENWNRRSFLAGLGVAVGSLWNAAKLLAKPRLAADKSMQITGLGQTGDVDRELGVTL